MWALDTIHSDRSLDLRRLYVCCFTTVHDMDRKKIIGNILVRVKLLESKKVSEG